MNLYSGLGMYFEYIYTQNHNPLISKSIFSFNENKIEI